MSEMNPELLCPLLQEMLADVTLIAEGLPEGWLLSISTYPDVSVNAPDGHWAGVIQEHDCAAKEDADSWTVWRGSLGRDKQRHFGTLEEAVDFVAGAHRALKADV